MVRGNNDKEWAENIPESLTFQIEQCRFFVVHNRKSVPKDLHDTDVVIYGHSHKYAEQMVDGVLWLNPGSCGKRRFDQEITFAVMTVDGNKTAIEKITIPHTRYIQSTYLAQSLLRWLCYFFARIPAA